MTSKFAGGWERASLNGPAMTFAQAVRMIAETHPTEFRYELEREMRGNRAEMRRSLAAALRTVEALIRARGGGRRPGRSVAAAEAQLRHCPAARPVPDRLRRVLRVEG